MKGKLKDPEYYFRVKTVWPSILYKQPRKQPQIKRISGDKYPLPSTKAIIFSS